MTPEEKSDTWEMIWSSVIALGVLALIAWVVIASTPKKCDTNFRLKLILVNGMIVEKSFSLPRECDFRVGTNRGTYYLECSGPGSVRVMNGVIDYEILNTEGIK